MIILTEEEKMKILGGGADADKAVAALDANPYG